MYRREAELHSRLERSWELRPDFDWRRLAADLVAAPGRKVLVALLDDEPIGFIYVRVHGPAGSPPKPSFARRMARRLRDRWRGAPPMVHPGAAIELMPVGIIEDCYVEESARRHGVGTALVEAGLGWFMGRGLRHVQLSVASRNEGAVRFWQSFGFEIGRHRMDLELE